MVDMPDLTPNQVVMRLIRLDRTLDQLVADLKEADEEAIHAMEAYSQAKDKALLTVEGDTVGEREARARLATHAEKIASELAQAKVRHMRVRISAIKSDIDSARSMSALLRSEMSL